MFDAVSILVLGFLLDCVLGDPRWMPHPVRLMGWMISMLERLTRRIFPKSQCGQLCAGIATTIVVVLTSLGAGIGILWLAQSLGGRRLAFVVQIVLCWQCIAAKDLRVQSMRVCKALYDGDIERARQAVAMIVGRDTVSLTTAPITRAAVETVAENTSDGVIAPLFFMAVGGVPLGLCYKAINTLDSMIGYKNEKYLYFGKLAAWLDDIANWIPARISAMMMIGSAYLCGLDSSGAVAIWRRDRRKHASPNSAQTEAVCAGALGVWLAGDAYYDGKLHKKPKIGDNLRPIQPRDILLANRMMYVSAILALLFFSIGRITAMFFI